MAADDGDQNSARDSDASDDSAHERSVYLLAFDQGTTNTKALLIDAATGSVVRQADRPVGVDHTGPGQVEQDGEKIWETILDIATECIQGVPTSALVGISISNQRESVAVWDAHSGELLGPVLGWQDSRTSEHCQRLTGSASAVRDATGLELDPMYSAPKMRWLLDNANINAGVNVHIGTIDTFLIQRLTGKFVTEPGNASRTLLFDIHAGSWSHELCELFGVPRSALAQVTPSAGDFGSTRTGLPIPAGIPVLAVLADSHAALYLHSQGKTGVAKATYGTGTSVMTLTPKPDTTSTVASTIAWADPEPVYAAEGNILASGAALDLMAELLTDGDIAHLGQLAANLASAEGVNFVPALSGLGAPYFDRSATGMISGITGGTTKAHLARAAFEAVTQQVADVVSAMESGSSATINELYADGGATASKFLMELQASVLQRRVAICPIAEASALGAALFACHHHQLPGSNNWAFEPPTIVDPPPFDSQAARRQWRRAIDRSRGRLVLAEDDY